MTPLKYFCAGAGLLLLTPSAAWVCYNGVSPAQRSIISQQSSPSVSLSSVPNDDGGYSVQSIVAASFLAASVLGSLPTASLAVSGGGLDYANIDITGQDFSKDTMKYKGKDFTQVIAKGTNFAGSNLQGCRFYKAYLVNADFSGADLRGASLEDTSMDGALLDNANVSGAYFSATLLNAGSITNVDFTDAQIPPKLQPQLCERPDAKGTNPTTGNDTRDSLMCL